MTDFSLTETAPATDDGYVLRTGKIFEAGSYPDKKFDLSPEEMMDAIHEFKPVPVDLEHVPTILDGKLGTLEAVAQGADGWSMIGTVRLPKWLDSQLGDDERKVSATWNRTTKKLEKLALVRNPRVKDAALMAAFAANEVAGGTPLEDMVKEVMQEYFQNPIKPNKNLKTGADFVHKTWEGLSVLQNIHDASARAGAVCDPPSDKSKKSMYNTDSSEFVSAPEAKMIQHIHDSAIKTGATCNAMGTSSLYSQKIADGTKSDKNKETSEMSMKKIKEFFSSLPDDLDSSDEKTATISKTADNSAAENVEIKDLKAQVAQLSEAITKLSEVKPVEAKKDEKVIADTKEAKKDEVTNSDATKAEPDAEKEALKAELNALKALSLKADAEKFADTEIKESRAFPTEREALIALFTQVAVDDSDAVKVSFKNGDATEEISRVDVLKKLYSVRKPHNLTKEALVAMGAGVLKAKDGNTVDPVAEAEKQAREYAQKVNKRGKK